MTCGASRTSWLREGVPPRADLGSDAIDSPETQRPVVAARWRPRLAWTGRIRRDA